MRGAVTAMGRQLGSTAAQGVLSLLYAAGHRPCAGDVERLLQEPARPGTQGARISHRPPNGEGWLELLASGLTFDMVGLDPAAPARVPLHDHFFGLPEAIATDDLQPVSLLPGEHISSGAAMIPVVRIMAGLAVRLAAVPGVKAVCWTPSASWMDPGYFGRIVSGWLNGGAFPALGLTALERTADGGVESVGLDFFIGQELRVEARPGEDPPATIKLAVRMIDHMVRHGAISAQEALKGPDGEAMLAEPTPDRRMVRLWRGR